MFTTEYKREKKFDFNRICELAPELKTESFYAIKSALKWTDEKNMVRKDNSLYWDHINPADNECDINKLTKVDMEGSALDIDLETGELVALPNLEFDNQYCMNMYFGESNFNVNMYYYSNCYSEIDEPAYIQIKLDYESDVQFREYPVEYEKDTSFRIGKIDSISREIILSSRFNSGYEFEFLTILKEDTTATTNTPILYGFLSFTDKMGEPVNIEVFASYNLN